MTSHTHSHDMDFKKDFTVEKQAGSTVKITGEIPFAELEKERSAAIKKLGANVALDGFRKGHVPENVLTQKIGEMNILSEMAERALAHCYPHILEAHEIDAVGYPEIEVTKLAPDNPLGFIATVAVIPEITLPDYQAIAKEQNSSKESSEVTDEDIETQVKEILRQKVAYERLQAKAAVKAEEKTAETKGEETDIPTPESEAAKEVEEKEDEAPTDAELPELTDELVKTLGQPGQFETVADFKEKIREHLTIEKERDTAARNRAKLTDAILEKTEVELPQTLIDAELGQMFSQMEEDLTRANLKMDDYLAHINKTRDDMKKEWSPAAEKRAKLQLVLNEIAKDAKLSPDKEEVEAQTKQLMEQHKDADENRVKIYVASVLLNEAVMKHLEGVK